MYMGAAQVVGYCSATEDKQDMRRRLVLPAGGRSFTSQQQNEAPEAVAVVSLLALAAQPLDAFRQMGVHDESDFDADAPRTRLYVKGDYAMQTRLGRLGEARSTRYRIDNVCPHPLLLRC